MTEDEAIKIIHYELEDSRGSISRLCNGEGIDQDGIQVLKAALAMLADLWKERTEVSKRAIYPLIDIFTRIQESARHYPGREDEIENLAEEIRSTVGEIFWRLPNPELEHDALSIVSFELSGQCSFVASLRHGWGFRQDAVERVQAALHTLQSAWRHKDQIPKDVAGVMLDARDVVYSSAGLYSEPERDQIKSAADALLFQVRKCLESADDLG